MFKMLWLMDIMGNKCTLDVRRVPFQRFGTITKFVEMYWMANIRLPIPWRSLRVLGRFGIFQSKSKRIKLWLLIAVDFVVMYLTQLDFVRLDWYLLDSIRDFGTQLATIWLDEHPRNQSRFHCKWLSNGIIMLTSSGHWSVDTIWGMVIQWQQIN